MIIIEGSVTLEDIEQAILCAELKPTKEEATSNYIISSICSYFNTDMGDVFGESRKREVAKVRHMCCFFIREITNQEYKTIGFKFNRDHATVMHSRKTIFNLAETDKKIRAEVDGVSKMLGFEVDYSQSNLYERNNSR